MANTSIKRIQIDKATRMMLITAAVATFVAIFTLVSSHSLLKVLSFQNRVIDAKSASLNQLNADISASNKLVNSYENFNSGSTNIIGGPITGSAQNAGDNSKVVLDGLPSVYDFPALATSLQYLLTNQGVKDDGFSGSDEGLSNAQPSTTTQTTTPTVTNVGGAVAMPFTFSVDGQYQNIQNLLTNFQKSIRPIQFLTLDFSGDQSDVTMSATAQTYYQPAIAFKITTKTVN